LKSGETEVLAALVRKAAQSEQMFAELIRHMRDGMDLARDNYGTKGEMVPSWL
jgi:predicted nucleic acid-binding protein